ncbi:MAG: type II toxin-antitoxin system prevent-host-death family antitoxin [Caldilinea sp. CFX5]|nr:type II toxin-antitoxin system prevent-host-death family antitoxin [Caldilinea sp. CFX5]
MIAIGISEFRANMNAILQRVQNGEIISLFVRETEVAKLVPPNYAQLAARQQLEELRQSAIVGDILSPLDESWDANK